MADPITLSVVSRGELERGEVPYGQWDDPDGLAPIGAAKLRTLLANPVHADADEPAQVLGVQGGRVIGRIDLVPGDVHSSGGVSRIYWGSNLYVPPEFRKTLLGVSLILKSQSLAQARGAGVGASGPSRAALPLYQNLKWASLPLERHILVARSRAVVERYLGHWAGARLLATSADAALRVYRLVALARRRLMNRRLLVERLESAPAEWDEQFAHRTQPIATHRSAAWLNWLLTGAFVDDPRNRHSLFVVRDRNGRVVAYFLNKLRFHETATHRGFKDVLLGSPQDWTLFDPAAISPGELLLLAVKELLDEGADAVDYCDSDPAPRGMLRLLGFKRLGTMHMMVRPAPGGALAQAPYQDLRNWWIRPADGDNFFC